MCNTNQNIDLPPDDNTQSNLTDLYKRYCDCRDQELDRFWKNSTYVWIFLAICFGAFGQVILKYLELKTDCQNVFDLKKTYEVLLSIISFIGLLCSFIWIWMARGMKAWFEVFEMAIWSMENDNALILPEDNKYKIEKFWRIKDSRFVFQKALFGAESNSPSKIVILIGRLLCLVWLCAFLWALFSTYNILPTIEPIKNRCWILIPLVLSFVFIYFCHFFIQGSVLLSDGEADLKVFIIGKLKELNYTNVQLTITRFLWRKRIIVDFDSEYELVSIKNSLLNSKTAYYTIKKLYSKNEHRLIVRCGVVNWSNGWRELFNMNIYNKHNKKTNIESKSDEKDNIQ